MSTDLPDRAGREHDAAARPWYTVAIIGAGSQGRAFAQRCVRAGFNVVLEDVLASRLRSAAEEMQNQQPDAMQRLLFASSVEDAVRDADVAIDFVPDELESKLEIFSMMDRMAPPRTVFCTPTALSITDLASCTYRARRCAALAPFNESTEQAGTPLKLVLTEATLPDVASRLRHWLEALGYPVQVVLEHSATELDAR